MTMTGRLRIERDNFGEKIETLLSGGSIARVVEVDQHCVIGIQVQRLAHLSGRTGLFDTIAVGIEQKLQSLQDVRLVVSREDVRRAILAEPRGRRDDEHLAVWPR